MSDTVYVLDQVGIRLVKEKTLISDTQLKRPEGKFTCVHVTRYPSRMFRR